MTLPGLHSVKISASMTPVLFQLFPMQQHVQSNKRQFLTVARIASCSRVATVLLLWPAVHTELAGSGIAVFGMDAHGHGRSEPSDEDDRALVHDFSHLVRSVSFTSTFPWHRRVTTLIPQPSWCAHSRLRVDLLCHSNHVVCNVVGRCAQLENLTTCVALHPEYR